jgi:hypothetical protein
MAKSSKKSKNTGAAEPVPDHQNGESAIKPAKPAKATGSKAKARPRTIKPGKATAAPRKSRTAARGRAGSGISDDEIRIRAYFISQDRLREGRPGSSADDWLEARRRLEEEASRRA